MELAHLKPKVSNKTPKRLGRGSGSGWGKTSGRGHKGAGQRSGKVLPYVGFRGGNLPFLRVIPKRGFNPPNRKDYQIVNLRDIQERIKEQTEVNPESLKKFNLIKTENKPIKILASLKGAFNKKLTVKADKFSQSAKKIIEHAGGKTECLKR